MAKQDFDFESFKQQKKNKYLKAHCKPKDVKKSKGGIVFLDYKMAGKKTHCVFIPFKKLNEAQKAFKQAKKNKEHKIKKTAFVSVNVAKGADGKEEITLEVKKGGIDPILLKSKGGDLFEKGIKMKLNVIGAAEEAAEDLAEKGKEAVDGAKEDLKEQVNKIKGLMVELADDMKNKVKNVAGKVKKKEAGQEDKDIADTILNKFQELQDNYDQAADKVKQKMQSNYDSLIKYVPQVEKIKNAVEKLIDNTSQEEEEPQMVNPAEEEEAKKFAEELKKSVSNFEKEFTKLKKEVQEGAKEALESGSDLLKKLK